MINFVKTRNLKKTGVMIKDLINISDSDNSLRPYQIESKKKIYEAWLSVRSVLFQMPTGTGKTRLFASIIKDVRTISIQKAIIPQPRILVLAHRTELIEQIANTITNKYQITCGIIKSGIFENVEALVQVASVQSLSRRLYRWGKVPFGLIVIDEAHHALARTYLNICSAFPNSKILGVTATPCRLNGESFRKIFDKLVISPSVQEFIDMGYLSNFKYYSIKPSAQLQHDLDNIRIFGANGDYAERELMNICDRTKIRAQIIKSYKDYAYGKKGIVYTINKTHNKHVAQQYQEIGVRVALIDSDTPVEERRQIVFDFKRGEIDIICNVNIFSEGFDCPDIEFIQLARPTLSLSLYLQQVGRALRISNGKQTALILDNVGSYNKFGLPNKHIDWNRYFNGFKCVIPAININKAIDTSNKQQSVSEANENMVLITESTDNSVMADSNSLTYTIYDILATRTQFPIGFRDYVYKKEYDLLRTKGNSELINKLACLRNIACTYASIETYIDDLYIEEYDEQDDMALNILENTYMFDVNGKYGVCRLKIDNNITALKTRLQRESNTIQVSDYFDILLEPIYDKIDIPNSCDCFVAVKNELYGVVNGNNLGNLIPFEYDELYEVGAFTNYIAKKANKVGVLGAKGEVVVPIKYDDVFYSLANGAFICESNGKYALMHNGELVYSLNQRIEQLTENLFVSCHSENSSIVYLTDAIGNILFPSGAFHIFLTNNTDEICLEFIKNHILIDTNLTLRSSLIDGKHPDRNRIFKMKKQAKRQLDINKQKISDKNKTRNQVHSDCSLTNDKISAHFEVVTTSKKKRPRIIRKVNLEK